MLRDPYGNHPAAHRIAPADTAEQLITAAVDAGRTVTVDELADRIATHLIVAYRNRVLHWVFPISQFGRDMPLPDLASTIIALWSELLPGPPASRLYLILWMTAPRLDLSGQSPPAGRRPTASTPRSGAPSTSATPTETGSDPATTIHSS